MGEGEANYYNSLNPHPFLSGVLDPFPFEGLDQLKSKVKKSHWIDQPCIIYITEDKHFCQIISTSQLQQWWTLQAN